MLTHKEVDQSLGLWRDNLEAFHRQAQDADADLRAAMLRAHDDLAAKLKSFEEHYETFRDAEKETIDDPDGGVHGAYDDLKEAFETAIGHHGP